MGLFEKIGRKLSGPRSNDGINVTDKPSSSSTANHPREIRNISAPVRNHSDVSHAYGQPSTVNGKPGIMPTSNGSRNNDVPATRNTKTTQSQPQSRQSNVSQNTALPAQSTASSIVPPISRLKDCTSDSRQAAPTSTTPRTSTSGQRPGETSSAANQDPQRQQHSLQKQPSVSSSLHSSRSPQAKAPNMVPNQQPVLGNMRGPQDMGQTNPPKSAGRDTRRMEDSAYHAGFRDAVAQLERERDGQGRGKTLEG